MKIVLFEDENYQNLLPLVYFRPVWELVCGTSSLHQKILNVFEAPSFYYSYRNYLQSYYQEKYPVCEFKETEVCLFVNGRIAWSDVCPDFKKMKNGDAVFIDDQVAAFFAVPIEVKEFFNDGILQTGKIADKLSSHRCDMALTLLKYPWEFVLNNGECIENEFTVAMLSGRREYGGAHLINADKVSVDPSANIYPGVVLNAENGAVIISKNCKVMPNAYIEGPVFIGENTTIKTGAKIYENTTIGPVCKIGGEVESSIIQGYSNKQHEGFLGHSYLGKWVNIGADTNNSDLRNDYGQVKVSINGYPVDSDSMFVGLIMGDHSKTAINTMFNTGTVVGTCCNVYGQGFPPKFLPSFTIGGSERIRNYPPAKVKAVAEKVLARRDVEYTPVIAELFDEVYKLAQKIENRIRVH